MWVAVGGRATLYGAVAGAILVNYGKTYFTAALPDVWLFALGSLERTSAGGLFDVIVEIVGGHAEADGRGHG